MPINQAGRAVCIIPAMPKPPKPEAIKSEPFAGVSVPERILLFCIASGTDWQGAGVKPDIVTLMIIKGLVQRDPLGRLSLTREGPPFWRR